MRALDEGDLKVLAALVQDAVFPASEMTWDRRRRRFAILLNRFRWEEVGRRPPERVQSVLVIEDVMKVAIRASTRDDPDLVLSLLTLIWTPAEEGGRDAYELILAGDGALAVDVEALESDAQGRHGALCRGVRQVAPTIQI